MKKRYLLILLILSGFIFYHVYGHYFYNNHRSAEGIASKKRSSDGRPLPYDYSADKDYVKIAYVAIRDFVEKHTSENKEDTSTQSNIDSYSSPDNTQYEKPTQNYCSLSLAETFSFLTEHSPFKLGSTGTVNFTKRYDYSRSAWVEGEINISGGMGSNSRLSGKYRVTNRNTLKISGLKASGGRYDASRNGDTYGSFTINCDGDIEGYLRDYNGNTKDVVFKK